MSAYNQRVHSVVECGCVLHLQLPESFLLLNMLFLNLGNHVIDLPRPRQQAPLHVKVLVG